jgi:hypothetical protein
MVRSNLNIYGAAPNPWPLRPVLDYALVALVVVRTTARTASTGLLALPDCISRGGQRRDGA